MTELLIKQGTCLLPSKEMVADILIKDGKIIEVAEHIDASDTIQTIDAQGKYVLPGLIDTQVHFRDPGLTHKEDLAHGMKGAVLGGVTGVFEMPNTNPATISIEALNDKLAIAAKEPWCHHAFYVGGTPQEGVDWHALESAPGCCGIKIFMGSSTGHLLVAEDEAVARILEKAQRRVAVHSEDEFRLKERFVLAKEGGHPKFHPIWRDEETALRCTTRLIAIAKKLNKKIHVLHVTTKQELQLLAQHKDIATVECLPQHLTFSDEDYERLGTRIQMNPPIRGKEHQDALWKAINENIVDILGSDHAPHTLEEKAKPYPESPSGMPGVQTIVPIMLHHVNQGKLTLRRVVELMNTKPVEVFGIKGKGALAKDYDADITIVDMKKTHTFKDAEMANKSGWTPYDGKTITGMPSHTIIAGKIIMQDGKLVGVPCGKPFEFNTNS